MKLPLNQYLSRDLELNKPSTIYFSSLEEILERCQLSANKEVAFKKFNNLNGTLRAEKLGLRLSAYFELDVFEIFYSIDLNPCFLDPRPDLQITLSDGAICYIECKVWCGFDERNNNNFNRAVAVIGEQFHSEWNKVKKHQVVEEKHGGLLMEIHGYNGNRINPYIARDYLIKESLFSTQACSPSQQYKDENLHFSFKFDAANPNCLGWIHSHSSSSRIKSFKDMLKDKKPDENVKEPYLIALCLWGLQGYLIDDKCEDEKWKIELLPGLLQMIKKYFFRNPSVSGILLFTSDFFPIQGINCYNKIEEYSFTQLSEKKMTKNGQVFLPIEWSRDKRKCIFLKNLKSAIKIPLNFEEKLASRIILYVMEI